MKRIKEKISFILVLLLSVFVGFTNVYASGSATYKFAGPTTATVGQEITITLAIDNINGVTGGIKGFSGNIQVSDATVLELQSGTAHSGATISGGFNKTAMKFNGLGMNGNIESTETIYDFKFKALKNGTVTITVINGKISDTNSQAATVSVTPITVTVGAAAPKSTDATLKALSLSGYTLTPAFAAGTLNYSLTANVPNGTSSLTFTATPNDSKATVSGKTCSLSVGSNTCKILVTAEDGTTKKEYKVIVVREQAASQPSSEPSSSNPNPGTQSNDANLLALGVSGYTLSPAFNKDTLTYTVDVPKTASKVTITATKSNTKATVTGTGDVTLAGENKSQTVTVTAEDGTTKTYTININLVEPVVKDSDNKLKSLEVSGYSLSPKFNADKTSYTLTVGADVNKIDVNALANSDKASVSVSGTTGLKAGKNNVTVTVTAEDGKQRTYTITVTKEGGKTDETKTEAPKSSDKKLKYFAIGVAHKITPEYNDDVDNYDVEVPYDVSAIKDTDIKYGQNDNKTDVKIENTGELLVGEPRAVKMIITAEDGSQRVVTLNFTRTDKPNEAKITDIDIPEAKDLEFDPETTEYTFEVGPNVKKLTLDEKTLKLPEGTKIKSIKGNENFGEGENVVVVKVVDKYGNEVDYTFIVKKSAKTILGMKPFVFWIVLGIILLLLALLLLLLLLRRKKEEEEEEKTQPIQPVPPTPVIDFKPEFNFGSRNGTDDDTVYTGGSLNQDSSIANKTETENKLPHQEPKYIDTTKEDAKEIPYDPYDEIVTKDELIDAIHEGLASKNPEKLKMLLEQEELNRKKEALRKKEEEDR